IVKQLFRHVTTLIFAFALTIIPAVASAAPQHTDNANLIRQIMVSAEKYQTLNSQPFQIGDSLKNEVEKRWGKSDEKSTVVANYYNRHVSFYYDHSTSQETITGIHDFGPELSKISLKELKTQLKKTFHKDPIREREIEG